jgi:hypothetical protein
VALYKEKTELDMGTTEQMRYYKLLFTSTNIDVSVLLGQIPHMSLQSIPGVTIETFTNLRRLKKHLQERTIHSYCSKICNAINIQ